MMTTQIATQIIKWTAGFCLITLLSACNSSDNNGGGTVDNGNQLTGLAANTANAEADELLMPNALQQDVNSLFGAANAEPVAVNANDTLSTVINRTQGQ